MIAVWSYSELQSGSEFASALLMVLVGSLIVVLIACVIAITATSERASKKRVKRAVPTTRYPDDDPEFDVWFRTYTGFLDH